MYGQHKPSAKRASGFVCPECAFALVTPHELKPKDLFCRSCGTSVAILDDGTCLGFKNGASFGCHLDDITPPPD